MTTAVQLMSPLGRATLDYAARGWRVFPCRPGAKVPVGGQGHRDATADPGTVWEWWFANPDANIGLNLAASGLVAVDADTYKPDCEWRDYARGHDLPDTLVQRSARGGTHHIYAAPPDATFAGAVSEGVDLKHDGYVLLEPSVVGGKFETDDDPAPAPDWLPRRQARDNATPREAPDAHDLAEVQDMLARATNDLERDD